MMSRSTQARMLTVGSLLAISFAGLPSVAVAQQSAAMQVGASVAPRCRIDVDEAPTAVEGIRVACGRSAFRTLRVSTDQGDRLEPVAPLAATQHAGGELVFRLPSSPQLTRRGLIVTVDF